MVCNPLLAKRGKGEFDVCFSKEGVTNPLSIRVYRFMDKD
jgi:hypothetical protein